jgi:hypothetical protein
MHLSLTDFCHKKTRLWVEKEGLTIPTSRHILLVTVDLLLLPNLLANILHEIFLSRAPLLMSTIMDIIHFGKRN